MPIKDIVLGLAAANGPSGAEGSASRLASELLGDFAAVRRDAIGNVLAELGDKESKNHILLEAHIDEISLVVTSVGDDGFLKADRCGGVDRRVLPGAQVMILGKKKLPGIVCCLPPHLTDPENRELPGWDEIYIDAGLPGDRARELVPVGSRILPSVKSAELLGGRVCAKALDNRAGCAALIRCVELLNSYNDPLPCRLSVVLSTGEEVAGGGAGCAAFGLNPTQAVCVDAGYGDQPNVDKEKSGQLGDGPMIGMYPVLDYKITRALCGLADARGIPWQYDVGGGRTHTNADDVSAAARGVPTALLSIPVRGMHTTAETADLSDIEHTASLLAEFVKIGGLYHDKEA